ncbi:hypothetical protein BGM30_30050 [Microcystis aeruginosa NIES-298]|uniref:Uncharacterized protein n=1 Tax=Microcystis aeruginosa NIES-298 TaxID=449468 RepID=A0A9P2YKR1_MICAE|nr:hypothetical protein BGM30_30050 [Microcystis aeruginosa NIES-298]
MRAVVSCEKSEYERAAVYTVIARASYEEIVSETAVQGVVIRTANQSIVSESAVQNVTALASLKLIGELIPV